MRPIFRNRRPSAVPLRLITTPSHDEARVSFQAGGIGTAAGFYSKIQVDGRDMIELLAPCGTCGVMFRRTGTDDRSLSDASAAEFLNSLHELPADEDLLRLARPLEGGTYGAGLFEAVPRLVQPGSTGDFFIEEMRPLHGEDSSDVGLPGSAYCRFGKPRESDAQFNLERARILLDSLVMPLQDPATADTDRVDHWVREIEAGARLTALAFGVLDFQGPAFWDGIAEGYPYREHRVLVHYLYDGHHRALACAHMGVPLRILSFVQWHEEWFRQSSADLRECIEPNLCE